MCKINGKKLEEIRIERGLSRSDLATKLGMSKSSIQKYEGGIANPSDKVADKICVILKVNRGEIELHDIGYDFTHNESKVVGAARKRLKDRRYRKPSLVNAFILENKKEKRRRRIKRS